LTIQLPLTRTNGITNLSKGLSQIISVRVIKPFKLDRVVNVVGKFQAPPP
jgi:hypothetical protein